MSLRSYFPIAKTGVVASVPGDEQEIDLPCLLADGTTTHSLLRGKVLLVDGLIVPGNSGGPVMVSAGVRTRIDPATNQFQHTKSSVPNLIIGVVSSGFNGSGLTIVYATEYVKETILLAESVRATGH